MTYSLSILGTRGVPAGHGGFETFAERLALFLVAQGWRVTVYCQEEGGDLREDEWRGIRRVHVPARAKGAPGTVEYDFKSTRHAASERPDVALTLGYNTALFTVLLRFAGIPNLINMDGLEWKRSKWSVAVKAWFYLNERLACWLGQHLFADHPEIRAHLLTRTRAEKISVIPYGADDIQTADETPLASLGLVRQGYVLLVARPEPENSILEVVRAFSRCTRGCKLVVLGRYAPEEQAYHRAVMHDASPEVLFPGAIYDAATVSALRLHCRLYVHGHQVGGTNPSLVEALGAGSAVLAHDNGFNRWVAGPESAYFADEVQCAAAFDALLDEPGALQRMRTAARARYEADFKWEPVLQAYEKVLTAWASTAPLSQEMPTQWMR